MVHAPDDGKDNSCDITCQVQQLAPHDDVPIWALKSQGYDGSSAYTYADALTWASHSEAGYMFTCIHTFGHSEKYCDNTDPWTKPTSGSKNDWVIVAAPLLVLGAVGVGTACLAALPACLYAVGDGAVGFYGGGSLVGTAGGLATVDAFAEFSASRGWTKNSLDLMFGKCSFAPATPVLMADGTAKPIKDVRIGDNVAATDPTTGKTSGKAVTALHDNLDTDLADVTITDASRHHSVLHTTQNHPFWDASTGKWTRADQLHPGDRLTTPAGTAATIVAVHSFTGSKHMLNLTVANIHTYYVLAGAVPVLVHNAGGAWCNTAKPILGQRPDLGQTSIYAIMSKDNQVIKWGVSGDPVGRYTMKEFADFGDGSYMKIIRNFDSDKDALTNERYLTKRWPGPKNDEQHAGSVVPTEDLNDVLNQISGGRVMK